MNTYLTVLIMCLLGYVAYVFLAESFNPFKKKRSGFNTGKRRGAAIIASLLALSGVMAFIDQSSTLQAKLRSSLGLSIILVALAIVCFAVVQLFRWWSMRREAKAEHQLLLNQIATDKQSQQQAVLQHPVGIQTSTATDQSVNDDPITDPLQTAQTTDSVNTTEDIVLESPVLESPTGLTTQSAANQSNFMRIVADNETSDTPQSYDSSDVVADDLFGDIIVSNDNNIEGTHTESVGEEGLPSDILVDSVADTDTFEDEELESNVYTTPTYAPPLFDNYDQYVTDTSAIAAAEWEDTEPEFDRPVETQTESNDIDWPVFDSAEVANGENINELQTAISQVTEHTDQIQDSVQTITSLTRKEAYYRTKMEQAQVDFEQAQREQLNNQHLEIQRSDKSREAEIQSRIEVEQNLSDKLFQLRQAEMRVRELEIALEERQSVFTDQMTSLRKTKAMARDAANLARRAAIAQHKARTEALQERAARERVELSAKKAVDIARNAISRLAEEEKRNRKSAH